MAGCKLNGYVNSTGGSKSTRSTNYDYFINDKSKKRMPSTLRETMRLASQKSTETIAFASGVPNVDTFPFEEFNIKLKDGSSFKIQGDDLDAALQYVPTSGYIPLVAQLKKLVDITHGEQDWTRQSLVVTCGASEPLAAASDMILSKGDTVIVPVPIYTITYDYFHPMGLKYICLEQDKDGVRPEELEIILEQRLRESANDMPKLMYINPMGCNPTGHNLSLERKRHLYKLACKYNFLILEDDPYYSVHFEKEDIESLLSMDTEGRVIRIDTFSKVLSSGLRVGYVTGPTRLLRQMELYIQVTTTHTSALSQVVVSKLLECWGHQRYLEHIENVKAFYLERRDLMLQACNKHLKGMASWDTPMGGMFLWVRIPMLRDTWDLAVQHCLAQHLLILPGHAFTGARQFNSPDYNYVRLSFTQTKPEQIEQGIKLLAEIIKTLIKEETIEFNLNSVK